MMTSVLFYLPNCLNYVRCLLVICMLCLIRKRPFGAFVCTFISGVIDSLDGDLARATKSASKFGYIMDLGLDKLTSKFEFCMR